MWPRQLNLSQPGLFALLLRSRGITLIGITSGFQSRRWSCRRRGWGEICASLQQGDAAWCYQLTGQDLAELAQAEKAAPKDMTLIDRQTFPLPNGFSLEQWRQRLANGLGVQLVKGFPVDRPESWVRRVFWGLGHHLGEPGAQNPQQELLGEVKDYGEQDPNVRLYRTPHNINLHCDAADVVGLLCLQTALRGGHSRIVSTVSVFNALLQERPDLVPHIFHGFKLDGRASAPKEHCPTAS